eukprot:TRINITY_DN2155_c0_g1_i5.p1 TRINITY_DN2155_c0_g1~~TRINITY_DN2155_c0_g1_i5.p1  ORF type:complete len:132 (+),score=16.63 TRINITY_DN2155_c0_g1_i5:161-556(+)
MLAIRRMRVGIGDQGRRGVVQLSYAWLSPRSRALSSLIFNRMASSSILTCKAKANRHEIRKRTKHGSMMDAEEGIYKMDEKAYLFRQLHEALVGLLLACGCKVLFAIVKHSVYVFLLFHRNIKGSAKRNGR